MVKYITVASWIVGFLFIYISFRYRKQIKSKTIQIIGFIFILSFMFMFKPVNQAMVEVKSFEILNPPSNPDLKEAENNFQKATEDYMKDTSDSEDSLKELSKTSEEYLNKLLRAYNYITLYTYSFDGEVLSISNNKKEPNLIGTVDCGRYRLKDCVFTIKHNKLIMIDALKKSKQISLMDLGL